MARRSDVDERVKRDKYVECRMSGKSKAESYRIAYGGTGNPEHDRVQANSVENGKYVSAKLAEWRDAAAKKEIITRDYLLKVTQKLISKADDATYSKGFDKGAAKILLQAVSQGAMMIGANAPEQQDINVSFGNTEDIDKYGN